MRLAEIQAGVLLGRGSLLHASSAAHAGRGVLFLAPSGGGKSTVVGALSHLGWTPISDDKSVVCQNSAGNNVIYPARVDRLWGDGDALPSAALDAAVFVDLGGSFEAGPCGNRYFFYRLFRDYSLWADLEDLLHPHADRPEAREDLREIMWRVPKLRISYDARSQNQRSKVSAWLKSALSSGIST